MKTLQKLILPLLLAAVLVIIYLFYFSKSGLGSFDDFDPNNNAVKEIRVKYVPERGVQELGREIIFYAADKNGKVLMVSGSVVLPQDFKTAEVIVLKGHLSGDNFHVHEVLTD